MESAISLIIVAALCCVGGVLAIALVISSPWWIAALLRSAVRMIGEWVEHRGRRTKTVSAMHMAAQAGTFTPNRFDKRYMAALNVAGLKKHKKLMETPREDRNREQISQWNDEFGETDTLAVYFRHGAVLVTHDCTKNEGLRLANLRDRGLVKQRQRGAA